MEFTRHSRRLRSVNLTPLIDVMFFLIIFFMVSTSFVMSESMELILPSDGTEDASATDESDVLRVAVNLDGQIEVRDRVIGINQFDQLIRRVLKQNKDQKIVLSSTPGVSVQQLVNALDVVYVNGGKNVQVDHYYLGDTPDIGGDVQLESH